jgi:hypothetical protein
VVAAEEWALFFHLLGAFLLIAGVTVAGVAFEASRRRRRPSEIALLLGLARVGVLLVVVGSLLVLAFGLWLVRLGRFGYSAGWVVAALALFEPSRRSGRAAPEASAQAGCAAGKGG